MNFFTALNKGSAFADIAKFNSESVSFPVCIPDFGMMSSYVGPQRGAWYDLSSQWAKSPEAEGTG